MKNTNLILNLLLFISPILGIAQGLPVVGQKNKNWCYAAATEIVLKRIDSTFNKSQCEIVKSIKAGLTDTCNCCLYQDCPKTNMTYTQRNSCDSCNNPLRTNEYKTWTAYLENNGYENPKIGNIKFKNIKKSIDRGFPVVMLLFIGGSLEHAVVASSYLLIENDEVVLICNDPASQCKGCVFLMVYNIKDNSIRSLNENKRYSTTRRELRNQDTWITISAKLFYSRQK